MENDDTSRLLRQYLSAREKGKEPYFDADQIEDLLNSFEESNDYTYFDEILALGLKLHPGNTALRIKQGKQLAYYEEYEEALDLLDNIAETGNQDLDLLKMECYCSLGQYPKAVELLEELIAKGRDYLEDIFEYISPILNDLDLYEEARDFVDRGLALFPDNLILKNELCYVLEAEGDLPKAIELCNELIDKNPFSYEYWFTLGRLQSMVGDYEKAIESFDFALTCDDSDIELKILKAYCLFMNESYEKAIEEYEEIEGYEKAEGDDEIVRRITPLMAECYMKLENFQKAYQLLSSVIDDPESDPEEGATNFINYIHCCVETGRDHEGCKVLYKATRLYPENIRLLSLLSLHLLESGKKDEAFSVINKIFKIVYDNTGVPEEFTRDIQQISGNEMIHYIHKMGILPSDILEPETKPKHIQPEDLVKEFLKNKDNNN